MGWRIDRRACIWLLLSLAWTQMICSIAPIHLALNKKKLEAEDDNIITEVSTMAVMLLDRLRRCAWLVGSEGKLEGSGALLI